MSLGHVGRNVSLKNLKDPRERIGYIYGLRKSQIGYIYGLSKNIENGARAILGAVLVPECVA